MVERHQLIENIKVEVQNMASISKEILFHASKFLEIMVFQLIFEIKWIQQAPSTNCSKQLVSDRTNFFDQNTCF